MDTFPEIQTWTTNVTHLLQIIGGSVVVLVISVLALTLLTSFGSENRVTFVRMAFGAIAFGIFLLVGAPRIAQVMQALTAFMNTTH